MKERRLKPFVIPMVYTICLMLVVFSIYFIFDALRDTLLSSDIDSYVSDEITNDYDYVPVVSEEVSFIRPYTDSDISVVRSYYDYKGEATDQEKSIVYYGNTYMQNSGVDYSNGKDFDVVSSISGTIDDVSSDDLMGKSITISDANGIKIIYKSLGEVKVSKGDSVSVGDIIGTSGTNTIDSEMGSHIHFELYVNDNVMNPEDYYDKKLEDILG